MKNQEIIPTILISGASGLLGHELVTQLLENGNFKVIAITSKQKELATEFQSYSNLQVVKVDNWKEEIESNTQIDTFINCAFPRSSEPQQLSHGLLFTEKIIKDVLNLKINKIINVSSQSVYSQKSKSLTDETAPIVPETLYGMTKYASERIIAAMCQNIAFSNIRLASLTSLDFEVRMTNRFVKSALTGKPIVINGGQQKVSYLDVRDAASALIEMLNKDSSLWKSVYNLGNHHSCTVLELAEMVKKQADIYTNKSVKLDILEGQHNFNNLINSELFYSDFNWEPQFNMNKMIEELFDYYKERV